MIFGLFVALIMLAVVCAIVGPILVWLLQSPPGRWLAGRVAWFFRDDWKWHGEPVGWLIACGAFLALLLAGVGVSLLLAGVDVSLLLE